MQISLITKLEFLHDSRRAEGKRHTLTLILVITIMAIMSQCYSFRGIEKFIKRHSKDLIKYLKVSKDRLPSYSTLLRTLSTVVFDELSEQFKKWLIENGLVNTDELFSIDGKAIKSTLTDYSSKDQNYISIVSAFAHKSGIVLYSKKFENKKSSEIPIVEELIKDLGLEGITFTLDALHTKKNS